MHPRSLFSLAEHPERMSKDGVPLEALSGKVELERFRPLLTCGLGYHDGAEGGCPAFDPWRCSRCWWFRRSITFRMRAWILRQAQESVYDPGSAVMDALLQL